MKIGKRSFSIKGLLLLADSAANELFSLDKSGAYKLLHSSSELSIDDYFPSEVERIVSRLLRHGLVEKVATKEGVKIVLTENGKRQALLFKLDEIKPKSGHWDGKWRIVFFDVEETQRKKRNQFRKQLLNLGFYPMQESVFISPFDCVAEIKYLREILDIPHEVKLGLMDKIENEEELKSIFKL